MLQLDITRALAIPGWMTGRELLWIADQATRCQTVIEVGAKHGRSTRAWADHLPPGGVVHTVDLWADLNDRAHFEAHLADQLVAGRVVAHQGRSADVLPALPLADLVFLDGDHTEDAVDLDCTLGEACLSPEGILAGHDYNRIARHVGVRTVVDRRYPDARHRVSIWWTTLPMRIPGAL